MPFTLYDDVMAITPISSVFKTILPNHNNRDRQLIIIHKNLDNSIFIFEKRKENIDINLSSLGLTQKPGLFTRIRRFISLSPETGFSDSAEFIQLTDGRLYL